MQCNLTPVTEKSQSIQLVNSDCFDFLPTVDNNSVDLVLIDPPYEVSRETNFSSGEKTGRDTDRFRLSMDFGAWDRSSFSLRDAIEQCFRVLKNTGTIICFYDLWKITSLRDYLEDSGFKQIRFAEWLKTKPVPINSKLNYLTNAREIAITGVKGGKPTFNSVYDNGIYSFPICHEKWRFHPTQKPLELIKTMILKHSNENDLVLDCFSGSGTTAVACQKTGRRFIGCEISSEYFDKSVNRIESECGIKISQEKRQA